MGLLSFVDWLVITFYLIGILSISSYFSFSLKNKREYFVTANSFSAWPLATSVLATQCSTNSILGAPAFVAFAAGSGITPILSMIKELSLNEKGSEFLLFYGNKTTSDVMFHEELNNISNNSIKVKYLYTRENSKNEFY